MARLSSVGIVVMGALLSACGKPAEADSAVMDIVSITTQGEVPFNISDASWQALKSTPPSSPGGYTEWTSDVQNTVTPGEYTSAKWDIQGGSILRFDGGFRVSGPPSETISGIIRGVRGISELLASPGTFRVTARLEGVASAGDDRNLAANLTLNCGSVDSRDYGRSDPISLTPDVGAQRKWSVVLLDDQFQPSLCDINHDGLDIEFSVQASDSRDLFLQRIVYEIATYD